MGNEYLADYALVEMLEGLGPSPDHLDITWAEFAGDRSTRCEFTVPSETTIDPFVEVQAYDVGSFGHEILLNDQPLSGFDIPPGHGWQYWMDAITDQPLRAGTNTIQVARDTSTNDSFAVANIVVNWRAPLE